tara:strand:- start:117 stop:1130 length:1014 start_codon:yes stop_codon:yes gene_type:complete
MFGQSLLSGAFGSAFDPTENFNTVLYTGDDTAGHAITTGFKPDLVWIKSRTNAASNSVYDSIRGADQWMTTNGTNADTSAPYSLTSFDANGFTLGDDSGQWGVNESPYNYVSWSWKAGGAAVSNTDGSTTSQVSANTAAGFSIIEYTGAGVLNPGHGLGAAPDLIIVKGASAVEDWLVYNSINGTGGYLSFTRNDDGSGAGYDPWQSNVNQFSAVTSTTFTTHITGSSLTYIAYCFRSIAGYSKIGSYAGSGISTPVTFGGGETWTPSLLIVKSYDGTNSAWLVIDSVRGANEQLYANLTSVEYSSSGWSFQSGGFTPRGAGNWDNSGTNYLYCAWA